MSRATDLYFEHTKSVTQFAYFQLGVAASAIAFAIHRTQSLSLDETPWPIAVAVALWAISFASGSFGLSARIRALNANTRYLVAKDAVPQGLSEDPEILATLQGMYQETDRVLQKPGRRFNLQLFALFAGALAFIAGHVMLMAKREAPPSASTSAAPPTALQSNKDAASR